MKRTLNAISIVVLTLSVMAGAQQSAGQPGVPAESSQESSQITVRGCIRSERQSYVLIADRTGMVYALQGVGNKLQSFLRKEVEVTGETRPGSSRTGVRPEKAGSNPSDTVHGVDGVPLEVKNIQKDIRVVAKHCTPADQQ